jgi:hypothetical protein
VDVGQTVRFSATVLDEKSNVMNHSVTWTIPVGAPLASVSTDGTAAGLAPGSATVQAEAKGVVGTAVLTIRDKVVPPPPPPPPPPPAGGTVARAELPRTKVNTAAVPPTGRSIAVRSGDDLQAAINEAQRGDVIVLEAGATFTGNFVLPKKPGSGWVTIRSATPDAALPPGKRVKPGDVPLLARLVSGGSTVVDTDPGASGYRLVLVEITLAPGQSTLNSLVRFGDPAADQTSDMPSDLILDRVYIHGSPTGDVRRCLLLSSASSAVIDSYLSDCHSDGFDAQAIVGWNGRGPYKIANCYLEGSGENIMFGGATPKTPGLLPQDIEVLGNHIRKPDAWNGSKWTIKNLLEVKFGRRILIEGNVLEGNWTQAQTGYAINLKTSAPQGMTWGVTEDVTIRGNVIRNSGAGISLLGSEGASDLPANRITLTDNILTSINIGIYRGVGNFVQLLGGVQNVILEHNTFVTSGDLNNLIAFNKPMSGLSVRNNILMRGQYGVKGSGAAEGTATLSAFAAGADFFSNLIIGTTRNAYPAGNWFAGSVGEVGFANYDLADFRLTTSSAYKGKGVGGRDIGADASTVASLTANVPSARINTPLPAEIYQGKAAQRAQAKAARADRATSKSPRKPARPNAGRRKPAQDL